MYVFAIMTDVAYLTDVAIFNGYLQKAENNELKPKYTGIFENSSIFSGIIFGKDIW